ncbi:MAG: extensin family protein [Bacteroidota bacterium]|nr:extensin family protein [Kiloniellaceae bacterium]
MRPLVVLLCLAALLAAGWYGYRHHLPARYDPFAPLAIAERPSFLTPWKLRALKLDPAACFAAVDAAGIAYTPIPDRATGEGCGFEDAARLADADFLPGTRGLPLTCPMIAALAIWERHDLQPAAERHLGAPVAELRHYGSYACRNVNSRASGRRSQHATANALDIAGFRLADGREISVARDWGDDDPAGRFLAAAHESACGRFASVLGPDYNAAHADHFHFDMGGFGLCR